MVEVTIGLVELIVTILMPTGSAIASVYGAWYKLNKRLDVIDLKFTRVADRLRNTELSNISYVGTVIDNLNRSSTIYKEMSDHHKSELSHKKVISSICTDFARLCERADSTAQALARVQYRMVDDINGLKTKLFDIKSEVILTEKGEEIIKRLSCVRDFINKRTKEIANNIMREEEICQEFGEQSKLVLLRRLILMTDQLLYEADLKPKDFKAVSEILKKSNYSEDVALQINISFLIYILREAVKQNLIPPRMLKLIDEANAQYSRFSRR